MDHIYDTHLYLDGRFSVILWYIQKSWQKFKKKLNKKSL